MIISALSKNPVDWLIDEVFRYTAQFEEQQLDKDFGMAGLPSISERDQRTDQDAGWAKPASADFCFEQRNNRMPLLQQLQLDWN